MTSSSEVKAILVATTPQLPESPEADSECMLEMFCVVEYSRAPQVKCVVCHTAVGVSD